MDWMDGLDGSWIMDESWMDHLLGQVERSLRVNSLRANPNTEIETVPLDAEAEGGTPDASGIEADVAIDSGGQQLLHFDLIVALNGHQQLRLQIPPRHSHFLSCLKSQGFHYETLLRPLDGTARPRI